ncbi:MAG: formylglycine-generating enzyme family protein [Bacteroidia bacterium]|nr:formylglycine-generating enzyme family protein [Bacteroidia bacterium]MCF8427288.1 formylglycine-generating enzyme family protein [Bacteroidia bacterium]
MRHTIKPYLFLLLGLLFLGLQSKKKQKPLHDISSFEQNFVAISDQLYVCKYETCNLDYMAFLYDVKYRMKPAIYQSLLPDTSNWLKPGTNNPPYAKYYLRHPAFAYYPLVNINYEQANFYLNWLSQKYNNHPKRPFKKVVFKLPTRKEWVKAAGVGVYKEGYPWGAALADKPSKMLANYCSGEYIEKVWKDSVLNEFGVKVKAQDSVIVYAACHAKKDLYYTQEVNLKDAKQTENGLYHVGGNVSEMISSKGDCVGGNFLSNPEWMQLDAPNEFGPGYIACPLVGFRVFMQVIEK